MIELKVGFTDPLAAPTASTTLFAISEILGVSANAVDSITTYTLSPRNTSVGAAVGLPAVVAAAVATTVAVVAPAIEQSDAWRPEEHAHGLDIHAPSRHTRNSRCVGASESSHVGVRRRSWSCDGRASSESSHGCAGSGSRTSGSRTSGSRDGSLQRGQSEATEVSCTIRIIRRWTREKLGKA